MGNKIHETIMFKEENTMKKEYEAPMLSVFDVKEESPMLLPASQQQDNDWANSKEGSDFLDDEEASTPVLKDLWEDEED